jgi:hypothetical protein
MIVINLQVSGTTRRLGANCATDCKQNQTNVTAIEHDGFGEFPRTLSLLLFHVAVAQLVRSPCVPLVFSLFLLCFALRPVFRSTVGRVIIVTVCIHTYHVRAPPLVCMTDVGSAGRRLHDAPCGSFASLSSVLLSCPLVLKSCYFTFFQCKRLSILLLESAKKMPEEDYDIYGEYEAYAVGRANQVGT